MKTKIRWTSIVCACIVLMNTQVAISSADVNLPSVPVVLRGVVRMTQEDARAAGQGLAGVTVTASTGGETVAFATTDASGAYSMTVSGGGFTNCATINGAVVIVTCQPVRTTFLLRGRKTIGAGNGIGAFEITPGFALESVSGRPSGANAVLTRDFTAERPAIVFLSGYLLSPPATRCPQTFTDFGGVIRSYTPGDCPDTAFLSTTSGTDAGSVPTALNNAGYHVQRAMLNINIFGSASIRNQVPVLTTAIDRAKRATGRGKVIVIAHSTGTIAARRYIESSLYRNDVSHYFSFGGPHKGWHFEALAGTVIAVSTISGFALTGSSIGAEGSIIATATFCALHQAACDMSRSSMASFNNDFSANPNVTYHFIHGDMQRTIPCTIFGIPLRCDHPNNADVDPLFRVVDVANTLAGSPANDGLIPTDGINAVQGAHDRMLTFDPHMLQVGKPYYFKRDGTGDESEAWENCINPVFIAGTKSTCGTVRGANVPLERAARGEQPASTSAQSIANMSGVLSAGQVVTRAVSLIDAPVNAAFVASWQGGAADLTLFAPDGSDITPALAATFPLSIQHAITNTMASYALSGTLPGLYTMVFTATSAPVTYTLAAAFDSALTFEAGRNRNWYPPGGTAVLTATLGGMAVSDENVRAFVRRSDGLTETATLSAQGGGAYSVNYTVPNASGYAEVVVVAEGVSNGAPFERARAFNFQIYPPSFKIAGGYAESASREALTVTLSIRPDSGGPVRVSGTLVDAATGSRIQVATVSADLITGTVATIPLVFDGEQIRASKLNGPYRLARVLVTDERESTLVSDDQFNVFTTTARLATDFGSNKIYLPAALSDSQ